nr:immunoglobulin light chain junction region [Macaca mulatta]
DYYCNSYAGSNTLVF